MILTTCLQSIAFAAFLVFPEGESKNLTGDLKVGYEAMNNNEYAKALKAFEGLAAKGDKKGLLAMGRLYQQGLPSNALLPDAKKSEDYFRKAIKAGEEGAELDLAGLLLADADEKRQTEGKEHLSTAATKNPKAKLVMGQLLAAGQGFTQDLDKAKKYFEEAGAAGEAEAFNFLGQMYEAGKGAEQSLDKALENYENAAKRESVSAMLKLGNIYASGAKLGKDEVKADADKAKRFLQNAAAKEDDKKHGAEATMGLANFYSLIEKKPEDAYAAYKKAAEIGDFNAKVIVGNLLSDGTGVAKDAKAAFKSYLESTADTEKGTLSGSPAGMFAVSVAYEKGLGTEVNAAKAKQWLMHSAIAGFPAAMRMVGLNYKKDGVKDIVACSTWLQRALQAGDAQSAMELVAMLESGENNIAPDFKTSNVLLTKVAEAGSPEAMLQLATNNAEGKGTSKDVIRAYALLLAAGDKYEPAKKKRDEMAKTLTKEQINEAMKEFERMSNKPAATAVDSKDKAKGK